MEDFLEEHMHRQREETYLSENDTYGRHLQGEASQ